MCFTNNKFFLALFIVLGFASCGSDEDSCGGGDAGSTENEKMVGTKRTASKRAKTVRLEAVSLL